MFFVHVLAQKHVFLLSIFFPFFIGLLPPMMAVDVPNVYAYTFACESVSYMSFIRAFCLCIQSLVNVVLHITKSARHDDDYYEVNSFAKYTYTFCMHCHRNSIKNYT